MKALGIICWLMICALGSALSIALSGCPLRHVEPAPKPLAMEVPEPIPRPVPIRKERIEQIVRARKPDIFQPTVIHFDFDRSDLRVEAPLILDVVFRWAEKHSSCTLLLEGHCDERGSERYNELLGLRRAQAAAQYLASRGLSASRMRILSHGLTRPVASGHDEESWKQNRRVEVTTIGGGD